MFPLAHENFNKNKFEEGIAILEQAILIAIIKYVGEEKVELAQFYNKYANGLVQKLIASNTDFLNIQEDTSKYEQDEQTSKKMTKLQRKYWKKR